MTAREALTACAVAGITLTVADDRLCFDAPRGAMTPELRATLRAHKVDLVPILRRLACMRETAGRTPVVVADPEAQGGPGLCFSCGDRLDHPHAYGRCPSCDVAIDLFYTAMGDEQEALCI